MSAASIEVAHRLARVHPRYPASLRLALARRGTVPALDWQTDHGENYGEEAEAGEVDGFTIRLAWCALDEPMDLSWLGEWTDDDGPDTVPNPDHLGRYASSGSYRRFRLVTGQAERADWLRGAGMARGPAWTEARRQMADDARMACDLRPYYVTAEAYRDGKLIGSASMGTDDDDGFGGLEAEATADDYGLIAEAVADAWEAMARRYGANGAHLLATVTA